MTGGYVDYACATWTRYVRERAWWVSCPCCGERVLTTDPQPCACRRCERRMRDPEWRRELLGTVVVLALLLVGGAAWISMI